MALCLLLGGLVAGPVAAQETSGAINGVVTDQSGAIIPGVTVTVRNLANGRVVTTLSGGDGTYVARPLEPGRYTVKFELPGFSSQELANVNVLLGQTIKLDTSMQVGRIETSVQV